MRVIGNGHLNDIKLKKNITAIVNSHNTYIILEDDIILLSKLNTQTVVECVLHGERILHVFIKQQLRIGRFGELRPRCQTA